MFDTWKKAWKGKRQKDASLDDHSEGSGSVASLGPEALEIEMRESEPDVLGPVTPVHQSVQKDVSAVVTVPSSLQSRGVHISTPPLHRSLLGIMSSSNQEEVRYNVLEGHPTPIEVKGTGKGTSMHYAHLDETSGGHRLGIVYGPDAILRARDENGTLKPPKLVMLTLKPGL